MKYLILENPCNTEIFSEKNIPDSIMKKVKRLETNTRKLYVMYEYNTTDSSNVILEGHDNSLYYKIIKEKNYFWVIDINNLNELNMILDKCNGGEISITKVRGNLINEYPDLSEIKYVLNIN